MNISGAIFDLDGTLLDTTEIWEGVAARYITSLRKTPDTHFFLLHFLLLSVW